MDYQQKNIAQKSKRAIDSLHIAMLHLFNRGYYKPMGLSGTSLREQLLLLQPEIYGSIANPKKFELQGLVYVLERLPHGIESCSFINLTTVEGLDTNRFTKIIPPKRRRNCYRIDQDQMNIEITRGRSDIFDVLTHLTFMYLESHKLLNRIFVGYNQQLSHEWEKFKELMLDTKNITDQDVSVLFAYVSILLNRTYDEVKEIYLKLSSTLAPHRFFEIIYGLGRLAIKEKLNASFRLVRFSDALIQQVGQHTYGSIWAKNIKNVLAEKSILDKPLHIISANMHSVLNSLYAKDALDFKGEDVFEIYKSLSLSENKNLRQKVTAFALDNGLLQVKDCSGANIDVQIIDLSRFKEKNNEVILVMDYAFGEQAFETMDELLKPFKGNKMNVKSISIMGKAGILCGNKGDIMIPNAHIAEGTADNYFFDNKLEVKQFKNLNLASYSGNMITVLGTSLQNKYILNYFKNTSWNAIGLEMEGAHYQKAIQIASKVRGHIVNDVAVRYAYYASDNPLHTGSTLASGGLGMRGVVPTYAITNQIINQILEQ